MSNLLINEPPLQVLPSLAKAIGLNEAIVLQQIHYWLHHAKVKHDDKMWIYKTVEHWQEQDFGFWSEDTIKRAIKSLRTQGLLLVEKLSNNSFNRVNHYTINYDQLRLVDLKQTAKPLNTDKGNMHQSIRAICTEHKGNMHQSDKGNMHQCLRDNKENTKESNNNSENENLLISIQDWQQPNLSAINKSIKAESVASIDQDVYDRHLARFKNFYAEQEAKGSFILTDNRRIDLLIEWIVRDSNHRQIKKAKTLPIAPTHPQMTNTATSSYRPSHNAIDTRQPTVTSAGWHWNEPLPNLSIDETYKAIADKRLQGESKKNTYDRLFNQMQEAV